MARKESNIHYIYKTTCNVTGRYYVGMHSTCNLEDGYMGSGLRLRRSLRKYGIDNHTKEILEFFNTREELVLREIEIVTKELIAEDLCMNLKEGGTGGFSNEQQKINATKSNEKQKVLRETNPEWVKKKNDNISFGNKKSYDEGKREKIYFYAWSGKTHSIESKELMSKVKKGVGIGLTNSQYGTCWITNEKENNKIFRGNEIPEGWRLGRKIK